MRGTLLATISGLLALILFILSIYTTYLSVHLSLPTIPLTHALSLLLPPLTFLLTLFYRRLTFSPSHRLVPSISPSFLLALLSLLDAILISLASSDLRPWIQTCRLETRWANAFRDKDKHVIGAIQDALSCCGLRTSRNMAWPFPDKQRGADACIVRFGDRGPCEGLWRERERVVLVGMVATGVLSLLGKLLFLYLRREVPGWIGGDREGESTMRRPQGRITGEENGDGRSSNAPVLGYLDEPEEERNAFADEP